MTYDTKTRVFQLNPDNPDAHIIEEAAQMLRAGGLVSFPTETVYGLGANALDEEAVARIFSAKGRPASDPIIVHLHRPSQLEMAAIDIPEIARQLAAQFWPGPLTLVLKRHPNIPSNVSAGMQTVAVRMPSHPVAYALLRAAEIPVAAPSANRFAHPSATTAQHVLADLEGHVDIVLDAGPANIGIESTVLDMTQFPPQVLRPGGTPVERLREWLPEVQVKSQYLQVDSTPGASPGLMTKHYSPRAKLLLFRGDFAPVLERMRQTAHEHIENGQRVGIMTPDHERQYFADLGAQVVTLGKTLAEISHYLFTRMRELDDLGIDVILVREPEPMGLGLAIRDRLVRAAEGHIIQVDAQ